MGFGWWWWLIIGLAAVWFLYPDLFAGLTGSS